jgi:outer membrane protein TolC
MVPVAPTIPAPVPPPGPHVRFQNLIPTQGKAAEPEKAGNAQKKEPIQFVETGPELSLGECISIALERQPSLKAARASMAATEAGYRSVMNFGTVGTLISPDLNIRKEQAQRGLAAAAADYQKAYNEVVQDVTRLYYTAVYARQQQQIADDLVGQLADLNDIIREILKTATKPEELGGLNPGKLYVAEMGLREAMGEAARARIGRQQALAALRQVMAVDEKTCPFRVKDTELPVMGQQVPLSKDVIVDLAVCRRPELALAAAGVDAFRLEVYAQGKIPFKRVVPTFASASDLHSKEVPQASRGKEYRPGIVSPEMPTQLVGSKFDRVSRAMTFSERAESMYESVRNGVILEAENSYFEFELASERLVLAKEKYEKALELDRFFAKNAADIKAKDSIFAGRVLAAKAQSDYVEAVYQYILALAQLERVTAGGIRPAFPGR